MSSDQQDNKSKQINGKKVVAADNIHIKGDFIVGSLHNERETIANLASTVLTGCQEMYNTVVHIICGQSNVHASLPMLAKYQLDAAIQLIRDQRITEEYDRFRGEFDTFVSCVQSFIARCYTPAGGSVLTSDDLPDLLRIFEQHVAPAMARVREGHQVLLNAVMLYKAEPLSWPTDLNKNENLGAGE
jgi:hypothetical protein